MTKQLGGFIARNGAVIILAIATVSLATCYAVFSPPAESGPPIVPASKFAAPRLAPVDPATQARDLQRGAAAVSVKRLRDAMHDPESFVLEDAIFTAEGAGCFDYRAKNGFGALRKGHALMTPARQIHNSDQGDAFVALWNKHCAGRTGEPMTAFVKRFVL